MVHLPWLVDDLRFPPVEQALADPNGLLAAGGDLSPPRLLAAYRRGIFPWYEAGQPILWWAPFPRLILYPDRIHISRSLAKVLRRGTFEVTLDRAFDAVIHACSLPRRDQAGTWITAEMKAAYARLHRLGHAHSVECWQDGKLAGGLYGVAIGKAFFGESMFADVSNSSKVALVHLAAQLARWHFGFIDCQMDTAHLRSMGAENVSRARFQQLLLDYTEKDEDEATARPGPWTLDWHFDGGASA